MGEAVISRMLTISVQASALILAVMLMRLLTRKSISPRLHYALWLLPALRLLLPFRFTSRLSLIGLAQTHTSSVSAGPYNAPAASLPPVADVAAAPKFEIPAVTASPQPQAAAQTAGAAAPDLFTILFWIWICGAVLTLAFTLYVNLQFSIRTGRSRERVPCDRRLPVFRVPGLASPCLCGCFRPVILVNDAALRNGETLSFVLKHELSHFRAGDQWWALARSLCCALHWFNPLVWWAAFVSRTDCELACDARVMKGFTQAEREAYGMALLSIIRTDGKKPALIHTATSMTSGKRELKARIQNIGKRPRTLAVVVVLAILIVATVVIAACTEAETALKNDPLAVSVESEAKAPLGDETAAELLPEPAPPPAALTPLPGDFTGLAFSYSAESLPFNMRNTFTSWTDRFTAWHHEGGGVAAFAGVMVNGSRENNILFVELACDTAEDAESGRSYVSRIALSTTGDQWGAEFLSTMDIEPQYRDASINCADLDGDGTDEIILSYYTGGTGAEADLHVYKIGEGRMEEIFSRYYDHDCTGAQAFLRENGALGLRVYYDHRVMVEQGDSYRNHYATAYGEFALGEKGWETIDDYALDTMAGRAEEARAFLGDKVKMKDDCTVYRRADRYGADLTGTGKVVDTVTIYSISNGYDEPEPDHLAVRADINGQSLLAALYERDEIGGLYYRMADIDGDGAQEIVLCFSYTASAENGEREESFELHVIDYENGGFSDSLVIAQNAPEAEAQFGKALFTLPASSGYPVPESGVAGDMLWAEVAHLEGRYVIGISHQFEDNTVGYSYIAFDAGRWKLLVQSERPLY